MFTPRRTFRPLLLVAAGLLPATAAHGITYAPPEAPPAPVYSWEIDSAASVFELATGSIGANPSVVEMAGTIEAAVITGAQDPDFLTRGRFYRMTGSIATPIVASRRVDLSLLGIGMATVTYNIPANAVGFVIERGDDFNLDVRPGAGAFPVINYEGRLTGGFNVTIDPDDAEPYVVVADATLQDQLFISGFEFSVDYTDDFLGFEAIRFEDLFLAFTIPVDVNNDGQIGFIEGLTFNARGDIVGSYVAPVPEPAAAGLAVPGLLALARRRQRRPYRTSHHLAPGQKH